MAAELGACRENGDVGDDSGHPASIPSMGRKRAARRNFPASWRSSGRLLVVAEDDDHGGSCGCSAGRAQERERVSPREKGKEGGLRGVGEQLQGVLLGGLGGKQEVALGHLGASTQVFPRTQRRRQGEFADSPLGFGVF
jgi:hypothetical protein